MHIRASYYSPGSGGLDNREILITSKFFSEEGDTVNYGREITGYIEGTAIPWGETNYYTDTISYTNLNLPFLSFDSTFSETDNYFGALIYHSLDTTYSEPDWGYYSTILRQFSAGLGRVRYRTYTYNEFGSTQWTESLVYCYKAASDEEWGTPLTLSITDQFDGSDYHVFPNPSKGIINWEYEAHLSVPRKIEVIDLIGRVVFSKSDGISNNQIDLSHLLVGTYLLKLEFERGHLSKRIVLETN